MMKSFILMLIAIVIVSVAAVPVIALNTIRKSLRREKLKEYFKTIAIGFDQAGGSILYGQEDWTVSSWTYNLAMGGNLSAFEFMKFIDLLFGKDHCKNSFFKEAGELKYRAGWM